MGFLTTGQPASGSWQTSSLSSASFVQQVATSYFLSQSFDEGSADEKCGAEDRDSCRPTAAKLKWHKFVPPSAPVCVTMLVCLCVCVVCARGVHACLYDVCMYACMYVCACSLFLEADLRLRQIRPQVQDFREHVRLEELPVAHDLSSPCMGAR